MGEKMNKGIDVRGQRSEVRKKKRRLKVIDDMARSVALVDEKFNVPYDELPYHMQLSCRAMARYILRVIRRWAGDKERGTMDEGRRAENKRHDG